MRPHRDIAAPTVDWILYCGAFDPPHQGHVDTIALAAAAFPDAKIDMVPSPTPAGASGAHKHPIASYAHRVAMCRLVTARYSPQVGVSTLENELPAPHYTVRTLEEAAKAAPAKMLALLIGQDQLQAFANWREPRRILELARLLVVPRRSPGESSPRVELARDVALIASALSVPESRILPLAGEVSDAASRDLRDSLEKGGGGFGTWLPKEIARYIGDAQLYRKPRS